MGEVDEFCYGPEPCVSVADLLLSSDELDMETTDTTRQLNSSTDASVENPKLSYQVRAYQSTGGLLIWDGSPSMYYINYGSTKKNALLLQLCTTSVKGAKDLAKKFSPMQMDLTAAEKYLLSDQFHDVVASDDYAVVEESVKQPSLHRAMEALALIN